MSDKKISAIIQENIDGAYYEVLLSVIPIIGENISLYSHRDREAGYEATHTYEVMSVLHEIHDVTDKVEKSLGGHHTAHIIVKLI